MKETNNSIIMYLDSLVAIEHLTDEQAGILFKAILRYERDGQPFDSSDTALIALFSILCAQIDRDHQKYKERCEKNSVSARKRWQDTSKNKQSHTIAYEGMPTHANKCYNDTDNDNDNDNNNDTDNNIDNTIFIRNESGVSFEEIWQIYGKPVGDTKTIKEQWNALSEQDRIAIRSYIPLYVASTPEVRYRKNFNNFLSERYWENNPINENQYGIKSDQSINNNEKRKRDVFTAAYNAINSLRRTEQLSYSEQK